MQCSGTPLLLVLGHCENSLPNSMSLYNQPVYANTTVLKIVINLGAYSIHVWLISS